MGLQRKAILFENSYQNTEINVRRNTTCASLLTHRVARPGGQSNTIIISEEQGTHAVLHGICKGRNMFRNMGFLLVTELQLLLSQLWFVTFLYNGRKYYIFIRGSWKWGDLVPKLMNPLHPVILGGSVTYPTVLSYLPHTTSHSESVFL